MNDSRAVLVVGGAGYLGSVLVEELVARGYAVTVFDRLFFDDTGLRNVSDRIRLFAGDMRRMDPSVLEGARAIINLGGLSNDPTAEYNPEANYQMNTAATEILATMAKERGIQRYLFASSCSIYDFGVTDEERDVLLTEESPVDPHAAYSRSKLEGERALLRLADDRFCPVILRMGTLFGFSPRMRYDLVVNTFVKDALSKGKLTLHYGGQMWRPLCEVRDAARAYVALLEADRTHVEGQVFNLVYDNIRISELALRVQATLAVLGLKVDIDADFGYSGVRNYRVSGKKLFSVLNFKPLITVEESVKYMYDQIRKYRYTNFDSEYYYNIRWMKFLEKAREIINLTDTIFDMPASQSAKAIAAGNRVER
jgi:nucleoside-diphosphate-sugar epimerase